jgi:hypothetical protein
VIVPSLSGVFGGFSSSDAVAVVASLQILMVAGLALH